MGAHNYHDPISEGGLVDGCPGCEAHGASGGLNLDRENYDTHWQLMVDIDYNGKGAHRSKLEATLCRALYLQGVSMERNLGINPWRPAAEIRGSGGWARREPALAHRRDDLTFRCASGHDWWEARFAHSPSRWSPIETPEPETPLRNPGDPCERRISDSPDIKAPTDWCGHELPDFETEEARETERVEQENRAELRRIH